MQKPPNTLVAGQAPVPLVPNVRNIDFPVDALPPTIARMVDAVADFTQTDPAMAATSALTALAAAACGRAEVEARPGWREPLVLQTATVAAPGERKSAVQQMMVAPLIDVEQQLVATAGPARLEAETQLQIAMKASERARASAGNAEPGQRDALTAEAISAAMMAEAIEVPPMPRLVADDVTPEAVASLLAEQGGRLAIISAEGGIFDIIAGRYSNVPNLDVFLKGHAGDALRVDRRGRDPEYVKRPALTVGVMIQPSVLTTIGKHDTFRGRGLLARFLYAVPRSKVGRRTIGAAPVPEAVSGQYEALLHSMALDLAGWTDPAILIPSPEAAEAVIRMERVIEPQLREDGDFGQLRDWGSKFVGAMLRIAGLLHLADHGATVGAGIRTPIPPETIDRAARIGAYYKAQAVGAFVEMGTDDATRDAVYLLDRIRSKVDPEQSVNARDLLRIAQRFRTNRDLEDPVTRLVDKGWLIPEEQEKREGPGRPPSPTFRPHPHTYLTQMTPLTESSVA